jgi:hypothetical protein
VQPAGIFSGHCLKFPTKPTAPIPNASRNDVSTGNKKSSKPIPITATISPAPTRSWVKDNPEYWQQYRETHPDYTERNRQQQQKRNQKRVVADIANMDACRANLLFPSGRYLLTALSTDTIAKMDSWTVEISVLSCICDASTKNRKERT